MIRDEYMDRLKYAKNESEKERILEEMHRRLSAIEEALDREKSE